MAKRPYLVEPPVLPVMPDRKGNDQGFSYDIPAFMYKRKLKTPLLQYLKDVAAWAEQEYETARLFYVSASNYGMLAWLQGITPAHVLGRSELVISIFELFEKTEIWQALEDWEKTMYVEAWKVWDFEKMTYEQCRQEQRRKRSKPRREDLFFPEYDKALMALAVYNRCYPNELTASQLTDAAIAEMA